MTLKIAAFMAALATVAGGVTQAPPLQLHVVSPVDGAYVSDRLMLEASIMPRERRGEISDVTFYADGKLVCRATNAQQPRCEWDAGSVIKPHLIRVVATTTGGERIVATSRTREVEVSESVAVRVVQVNASVTDRDGRFVPGLTSAQFRVREDGRPQKVQHFASEEAPLEIVVAMDISGSMAGAIDDLKEAVRQFLVKLRPADRVTLVAFNDDMFVLTRGETSPDTRLKAVDRLTAWGGTTLYDVIIRSLELVSREPGRRSLVVFSDGEDQSSQASFATVDRALKGSDATLFMVGLGRGRQESNLRETLEALAEPTGGRALFADRPSDLGKTFADLLNELTHQYLIGYESTNLARDGAWRKIELDLPETRYRVRARQGYFAPAR
jgi:Ca-activated chloride channel family protein